MSDNVTEVHYDRHWLNKDRGRASFIAKIMYSKPYQVDSETPYKGAWVDADININDCDGKIYLDFDFWVPFDKEWTEDRNDDDVAAFDTRIEKLNGLIESLEKFREAMITAEQEVRAKYEGK